MFSDNYSKTNPHSKGVVSYYDQSKIQIPFFEEDIFCDILFDVIFNCMNIKPFNSISSKINTDHINLTIQLIGVLFFPNYAEH